MTTAPGAPDTGTPETGAREAGAPGTGTPGAGTAVYLYGMTRGMDASALDGVTGVADEPVRALVHPDSGLTALISTVSLAQFGEQALRDNLEDLTWLEGTARAHHRVVTDAARHAPTAPVRIATLYRDERRVLEVLEHDHRRLLELLDRVTGRTEWGIKAYAIPEAVEGTSGDGEPGPEAASRPSSGTAYLQMRQAARRSRRALQDRLAEQARAVHAELADHAVASRQHAGQDSRLSGRHETLILNMAYLVDDEQAEGFHEVARAVDRRLPGVTVEVTGPWPPYSFIDSDEATPAPAPGGTAEGTRR
ncbi:GvpL/GvpF family gas vesicle protein [Spirillospora sp. NPDC049652]